MAEPGAVVKTTVAGRPVAPVKVTVKVKVAVPASPSARATSSIEEAWPGIIVLKLSRHLHPW